MNLSASVLITRLALLVTMITCRFDLGGDEQPDPLVEVRSMSDSFKELVQEMAQLAVPKGDTEESRPRRDWRALPYRRRASPIFKICARFSSLVVAKALI
jgi:hypothetical protein